MLGPLATHPNFRKRGAGKQLAREVTRIALERGEGSFVICWSAIATIIARSAGSRRRSAPCRLAGPGRPVARAGLLAGQDALAARIKPAPIARLRARQALSKEVSCPAADELIEQNQGSSCSLAAGGRGDSARWLPTGRRHGGFSASAARRRGADRAGAAWRGAGVLYTERSPDLRSHSGQMRVPGGKIDPEDDGPADAALREAKEEVALDPRRRDDPRLSAGLLHRLQLSDHAGGGRGTPSAGRSWAIRAR